MGGGEGAGDGEGGDASLFLCSSQVLGTDTLSGKRPSALVSVTVFRFLNRPGSVKRGFWRRFQSL